MNWNAFVILQRYKDLKEKHPRMRIRDAAETLGVSEAELLECQIPSGTVQRLRRAETGFSELLEGLCDVGEVMCLTRNHSAVHERYGVFGNCNLGKSMGVVLNRDIDLRVFMHRWAFGFVETQSLGAGETRLSLQFFDASGTAVHKIYQTQKTDAAALENLISEWVTQDLPPLDIVPAEPAAVDRADSEVDVAALRAEWAKMYDPHEYIFLLRKHNVGRLQSLRLAGPDWAYPVDLSSVSSALTTAAETGVSVMIFVGSPGCIQIHTDPIKVVKPMGPWINVLDERFNLHLRNDHVAHVWVVKKPTDTGFVHSLEAYDAEGRQFFQMFGERKPGVAELPEWVDLLGTLQKGPIPCDTSS